MPLNNAIIGFFHDVSYYFIASYFKVGITQIKMTLAKIEKKKLIKILHDEPLIAQLLEVCRTCTIATFRDFLVYVKGAFLYNSI